MASLADASLNMLAHDNLHDFDLFPEHASYSAYLSQDPSRQDGTYAPHAAQTFHLDSSLGGPYPGPALTTWDAFSSVPAFSDAPSDAFFDPPRVDDVALDASRQAFALASRRVSPATSASHSFEQPSSGPSVPSAASSAMGSPYASAARPVPATDAWADPNPSIVPVEPFGQATFVPAGMEHELLFADDKLSGGFVAAHAGAAGRGMTIDTILDEVNRRAASADRATSRDGVVSDDRTTFRSPVTPASARGTQSPRSFSPVAAPKRKRSLHGASMMGPTPKRQFSPAALPSGPERREAAPGLVGPHPPASFGRNSGSFVAPLGSSYPALIHPFHQFPVQGVGMTSQPGDLQSFQTPQPPLFQPASPAQSIASARSQRAGSANFKRGSESPYLRTTAYQPYQSFANPRRPSVASIHSSYSGRSQGSPHSSSLDLDEEKGRCPNPECGKVFKDLKAHMLTHQSERPEKCPIVTCDYHHKGFARKYDKNRHTLTHYKGTMVCGFCPGSGSAVEKSFNRADVFKRHLTAVHGVEQAPPNSRKKSATAAGPGFAGHAKDATGKCSTCSETFRNAQDFYEHLDDCVLRVVQQEDPSEAINERHLSSMDDDATLQATLRAHAAPQEAADDAAAESGDEEASWPAPAGGGVDPHVGGGTSTRKTNAGRRGLTFSKGGVPLLGRGRKKRKHYPPSWGCPPDKMKMKKRVLCVFDGPRRLWKDDMMLDSDFEVRLSLGEGKGYVTDLDVQTLRRAEALHNTTEEERGPWPEGEEGSEIDIEELMS
ncbi:MAG: hypothetical protein M1832_001148 [Thelocarpon impressellum]|nr:MAG: hypothetical protein M1832_001148 [Thelocarpon impressellum]